MKKCFCGNDFIAKNKNQIYCSTNCNTKAYASRNVEKVKTCKQKYTNANKLKIKEDRDKWKKANPDKMKSYRQSRKDKNREYWKNRRANDITFKIKNILRNRLNAAIKNNQKVGSAVSDLGCSIKELKIHLESNFEEGMNWDNHGEWHIDHIKPLDGFDLTNREELLKACHYTNLQPLWAIDNLIKSNKE